MTQRKLNSASSRRLPSLTSAVSADLHCARHTVLPTILRPMADQNERASCWQGNYNPSPISPTEETAQVPKHCCAPSGTLWARPDRQPVASRRECDGAELLL